MACDFPSTKTVFFKVVDIDISISVSFVVTPVVCDGLGTHQEGSPWVSL